MTECDAPFAIGSDLWPGLSKLIEECGEVIQVAGKLIATHGEAAHWDGSDLRQRLHDELADLDAAIRFVVRYNGLDDAPYNDRTLSKGDLFVEWHEEQRVAIDGLMEAHLRRIEAEQVGAVECAVCPYPIEADAIREKARGGWRHVYCTESDQPPPNDGAS